MIRERLRQAAAMSVQQRMSAAKMKRAGSIRPFFIALNFLEEIGAGEAIRTLDPNLGKVVLYP